MVRVVFIVVVLVIVIVALGMAGYFYKKYNEIKRNPDLITKQELIGIIDDIGKFVELPEDEQPTLATVTDKEKLKDQDFFKKSINGDKILIYTKAKKAILYRPSTGKVIEFAQLLIGDGSQETNPTSEPQKSSFISVIIYNGTKTTGLTSEIEKKIINIKDLVVEDKTNAVRDNYSQNIVVDISGLYKNKANEIAEAIDGMVSTLPDGENKPETDILIIAGK